MQTAIFYGASDDLIEVEGVKGADEFSAWLKNDEGVVAGSFVLGGKIRVRAIYDGCWTFAVGQVNEDVPLPAWPVRMDQSPEVPYSARLTIEVPDDVVLFRETT
jgi:hypothetical protein